MAYREITVVCFGTKYTARENMQCLMTLEQVVSIVTAADVIDRERLICAEIHNVISHKRDMGLYIHQSNVH